MPNDGPANPFNEPGTSYSQLRPFPQQHSYSRMKSLDSSGQMPDSRPKSKWSWVLVASYVSDWIILVVFGIVGMILGNMTPNKRPFSLQDPNISFPYTVDETVPAAIAFIANSLAPAVIIAIIALIFVPGATVPRGTPKSLVWRRKLWELHIGLLGLALSVIGAWFITNGMKNMFGKPRPDLLSRCQPDIAHASQYIVGGFANSSSNGQLVSADICTNTDKVVLDDGFRSYPSGHSSSSAAGLIYLSLFIASKFAITIPFLAPSGYSNASSYSAFPSRLSRANSSYHTTTPGDGSAHEEYELADRRGARRGEMLANPADPSLHRRLEMHTKTVAAVRRQAAAPPLYLLAICALPTFAAIFISSTRWFDFRHHGFDILFGFFIGLLTSIFAFRYYHLPISQGAGWAWGPRSSDKAFWAGVGSYSYATDHMRQGEAVGFETASLRPGDEEEAIESVGRSETGAGSGWGHYGDERAVGRKLSPAASRVGAASVSREQSRDGSRDDRREREREEEIRFGTAV